MPVKTIGDVRAEFQSKGITFAAWARANDIPRSAMRGLMSGATKGQKGMGRKAALMLGMVEPHPGEAVPQAVDVAPAPRALCKAKGRRAQDVTKKAVAKAIHGCGLSREAIAAEMSRLTGESISHFQINNWTALSKSNRSMPLEYAPALGIVTGDHAALRAVAEMAGCLLLEPEQVPFYELGRITAEDKDRAKRRKELMERIKS